MSAYEEQLAAADTMPLFSNLSKSTTRTFGNEYCDLKAALGTAAAKVFETGPIIEEELAKVVLGTGTVPPRTVSVIGKYR
jgi:hypothetical protein